MFKQLTAKTDSKVLPKYQSVQSKISSEVQTAKYYNPTKVLQRQSGDFVLLLNASIIDSEVQAMN